MSVTVADPRSDVLAPVRAALGFLILRGAASFAVAVIAVIATLAHVTGVLQTLTSLLLPGVLVFVLLARGVHVVLTRKVHSDGTRAWQRARELDSSETMLAGVMAIAVPIAWLTGSTAILVRHLAEPALRAAVASLYAPVLLLVVLAATYAWAGDCRERLAIALAESDRRFRTYWAEVGRPS
jgi:hypothetical protein